ncbi:MAG: hypothetical protein EAZ23_20345 [Oscillatoriales cyanobacterium]|nr:MAG: hypothetical protein EAZ23_20345 [Oscillatoriales cyanobacterium]
MALIPAILVAGRICELKVAVASSIAQPSYAARCPKSILRVPTKLLRYKRFKFSGGQDAQPTGVSSNMMLKIRCTRAYLR